MTTVSQYATLWDAERPRLTGLAYRILGSWHDAEDVVSQAWLRLSQQVGLERPEAWLTTVVTRLAIDAGRRQRARRENYPGPWLPEPVSTDRLPEDVAEQGSLLRLGLLRLMDGLSPEDRAVFVLRQAFDVPYDEIAACVGRSPAACRQVVSRARAALPTAPASGSEGTDERLITAMVQAVRNGDVSDVVRLLSEDCVLWADGGGVVTAARRPVVGPDRIASFLMNVARLVEPPEVHRVNGTTGMLFRSRSGAYFYVLEHDGTHVTGIQVQAHPDKLRCLGDADHSDEAHSDEPADSAG